jgi:hypothetical protein
MIRRFARRFGRISRARATEKLEYELREMESVFIQLLFSSLAGLTTIPEPLALELLPCMREELDRLESGIGGRENSLAELFGKLGFD